MYEKILSLFQNVYFYIISIPISLAGLIYWKQDMLLYVYYMPSGSRGKHLYLPSRYNLPFEDVYLKTRDGVKIHAWFIRQKSGILDLEAYNKTPTIIYFHGNAGNISHRLRNVAELYRELKCNILLVEYRGYGISEGYPSEEGLKLDAEAIEYIFHRTDLNSQNIFVFGRSLGSAVALSVASKYQKQIKGLIVENAFTDIGDMIDLLFPAFKFAKFLSRNQWKNNVVVKTFKTLPILFISGLADELIPPRQMRSLFDSCTSKNKQMKIFPNGTHNETWNCMGYYETIINFVTKYNENKF
eukprot:gene8962-911_t